MQCQKKHYSKTWRNLHQIDVVIRLLIATILVGQIFFWNKPISWHWSPVVLGLYFAMSALIARDPIYDLFNFSSIKSPGADLHDAESHSLGVIVTRFHFQSAETGRNSFVKP